VPAAAVIPAPRMNVIVVAVKKLVVGYFFSMICLENKILSFFFLGSY